MVTEKMSALLGRLGATELEHSARPLLDHLDGTRAVSAVWGSPTELRLAGLLHSAYGAEGGAARARDGNRERRAEDRRSLGFSRISLPICTAPSNDGSCSATPCGPVITPSTIFSRRWRSRYRKRRGARFSSSALRISSRGP
jgi:hypothetical protein